MARKNKKAANSVGRSLIADINPKSPIAEQFRTIRTNLQFTSVDKELETMLVTSASPSEGKSITTANTAVVFAQQGKKVLLVDADLRKPTIHYTFRVNNTKGLSNYLVGDQPVYKLVSQTEIENLDTMTCGPIPPNPSELLGSKKMQTFIDEAKETYDMIIFDTPPVLAVTDSQVLSKFVDGCMLVVRSKQTDKEAAAKAKEHLEQTKANLLGVVLNDQDIKSSNYYYYYGH
ncbi:CpsD/CapB family tyrosine-protein kinase [Halobacillus karajensis]|uniref:non-specific protein-tyrosine kinase n=1 Tax=Halobacillus karajensis TaxID=195088 RepID=A0A059NV95_9BACI|nr:CpsD/CapB family tyrosine-protein kinase [Halobacillus karajensis]CDQ18942.1 Tyrosine-protein kinase YwqD [Halobacillus karajensis]CDQ22985.1 Tyrosine-protein kinase YwqD [Halobacillus karajensis]CDQ26467.1 Tyrosine-protein kinase YwqD [Halobacillus karajensis]